MTITVALAIVLATGAAADPEVCVGIARETDPQYRIVESDLDRASAVKAAERLRDMAAQGHLDGEYHYGALNHLKVLKGHVLLSQALSDRAKLGVSSIDAQESAATFCAWLVKDGFWYD